MSDLDLGALERALAEATPGPWRHHMDTMFGDTNAVGYDSRNGTAGEGARWWATGPDCRSHTQASTDAALIVAAVNALPGLIAEVRRLTRLHSEAEARVECRNELRHQVAAERARAEVAEAEAARLRKLFDDAGQGEHNVLALVDFYIARAEAAEADRATLVAEHNSLRASLNDAEAERDAAEEVGTRQRDRAKAAEADRDALRADHKRNLESWSNDLTLCLGERDALKAKLAEAERAKAECTTALITEERRYQALQDRWLTAQDRREGEDDERDALRKHRDELCAELRRVTDEKHQVFRKERDALRARVERLEAVVRRYAFAGEDCRSCARYDVHHDECPVGAALESSDE
jgi:chromosome segregation ATPase